jgi:hypothetical protein
MATFSSSCTSTAANGGGRLHGRRGVVAGHGGQRQPEQDGGIARKVLIVLDCII